MGGQPRWKVTLRARTTPVEAIQAAAQILERLGFDPEPDPKHDPHRILLHRCPFSEVAKENRAVICGIHSECSRATFERLDTSLEVAGLDSFVTDDPLLCIVRLATKSISRARARLGRQPDRRNHDGHHAALEGGDTYLSLDNKSDRVKWLACWTLRIWC